MRLHILSDLHLEFGPFVAPNVSADVVVLAGDIHTGIQGVTSIARIFPDKPIIYVLGNHEFYGETTSRLEEKVKKLAQNSNIHVLQNDSVEIGGVLFLGATLWTDYALTHNAVRAEAAAASDMNDFRRIRVWPTYRKFRPADARRLHTKSLEWLKAQIKQAQGKKIVVVTHHAPSARSIDPSYCTDPLNPAYASNLEDYLSDSGIQLWVHGHIHRLSDYTVGKTRVIANPRGYVGSEVVAGFNPTFIVDV